jgi:hypothetical protein
MTRREFPRAVRATITSRATDMKGRIWCEQCGAECLSKADYELDHIVAEGILPANDNLAPLTAESGALVCLRCHDKKTRRDVFEIAKAKRLGKSHRVVGKGQTEVARRFGVKQEPD